MSKTKKHLGELMDVPRVSENGVVRDLVLSLMHEVNLTGTIGISAWGFFFPSRNTFITVGLKLFCLTGLVHMMIVILVAIIVHLILRYASTH